MRSSPSSGKSTGVSIFSRRVRVWQEALQVHHQHLQAIHGRLLGQSNMGHWPVQMVGRCTTTNGVRWPASAGWRIITSKGQSQVLQQSHKHP